MRNQANPRTAESPYAEFIKRQVSASGRPRLAPATSRGWDERLAAVRRELTRSMGHVPEQPCRSRAGNPGYAHPRRLRHRATDLSELAGRARNGQFVSSRPAEGALPGRAVGAWPLGLGSNGPARPAPLCCPGKAGLRSALRQRLRRGQARNRAGFGHLPRSSDRRSLWPAGCSLLGLQVYDNRRAVDYLASRPEVDPARLAITGASGGGNQTLYAGASERRLSAVIPVCGIGTYDAYLSTACCVCEVNLAGAVHASTGDLLAMVAPRALLVISATRDAHQFSVGEASRSVGFARERFRLLGVNEKIRHVAIDSGHDYNQPMREAMYGWVEKWLNGRGDGSPVPEPKLTVEEVAAIRCYPDGPARPKSIVTIPRFARSQGQSRLALAPKAPDHREQWDADAARMRAVLRDQIFGGFPARTPLETKSSRTKEGHEVEITTEPGLRSRGIIGPKVAQPRGTALIVAPGGLAPRPPEAADDRNAVEMLRRDATAAGFATFVVPQPRATGTDRPSVGPIADVVEPHTRGMGALDRPATPGTVGLGHHPLARPV